MATFDEQFEHFMNEPLSSDNTTKSGSGKVSSPPIVNTAPAKLKDLWWVKNSSKKHGEPSQQEQKDADGISSKSPACSDVVSSLAEFLQKEKICKEQNSSKGMTPASGGGDLTDDDLSSIKEQLSAGGGGERSVEEILKEYEEMQQNDLMLIKPGVDVTASNSNHLEKNTSSSSGDAGGEKSIEEIFKEYKEEQQKSEESWRRYCEIMSGHSTHSGDDSFNSSNKLSVTGSISEKSMEDIFKEFNELSQQNAELMKKMSSDQPDPKNVKLKLPGKHRKDHKAKRDCSGPTSDALDNLHTSADFLNRNLSDSATSQSERSTSEESDKVVVNLSSDEMPIAPQTAGTKRTGNNVSQDLPYLSTSNSKADSRTMKTLKKIEGSNTTLPSDFSQPGDVLSQECAEKLGLDKVVSTEEAKVTGIGSCIAESRVLSLVSGVSPEVAANLLGDVGEYADTPDERDVLSTVMEESSVETSVDESRKGDSRGTGNVLVPSSELSRVRSLELELVQEQKKVSDLKGALETKENEFTKQRNTLKQKYETQLFELQKDIRILKAHLVDSEAEGARQKVVHDEEVRDQRVALLEKELQEQEKLIQGCQRENLRLCQDIRQAKIWSDLHSNSSEVDALVLRQNADAVKELLSSSNVSYSVVIEDLEDAIRSENPVLSEEEMAELEGRKGHRMTWQAYHRMADVHGYLDYLAQTFPKLCSVKVIGSSGEGRPLKVLKISSGKPGSRAIWIDGGIHAREWISPATVTYIINELVENYESHGEAIQAVDWYILPIVNPDGYEYTHSTNRLWRKNRRNNPDSRCLGVDLNRNFGYKWGGKGASRDPCTEIYAGQYGFSEPETSALSSFLTPKSGTLKEELKAKESQFNLERQQLQAQLLSAKQRAVSDSSVERESLLELIKDKEETIVKLKMEADSLKVTNEELRKSCAEYEALACRLQSEIERLKKVSASSRPGGGGSPLAAGRLARELEQCRRDLEQKEAESRALLHELTLTRDSLEARRNELTAAAAGHSLQVEALEARVGQLQSALAKDRAELKMRLLQSDDDKKKILDLTRQVKEMERILKRKHPNSISALIMAANSEVEVPDNSPRIKYLENRVQQLEQELQVKGNEASGTFQQIQEQFHSMKVRYEQQVASLELELGAAKHEANQAKLAQESSVRQRHRQQPPPVPCSAVAAPPANALAVREDSHLVATIRGLRSELASRERDVQRLRRELEDSRRAVRRLQACRVSRKVSDDVSHRLAPTNNLSNQESGRAREEAVTVLEQQNTSLRRDLQKLEEEYRQLKMKRIRDLNLLQEQHEVEMQRVLSRQAEPEMNLDSRVAELQSQLCRQKLVVSQLREQLKQLDECQEEIAVLRTERDHLERTTSELNKKLVALRRSQLPEDERYEALQERIVELESRHEVREERLQAVVRDLLRRNAEQRALLSQRHRGGGRGDEDAASLRQRLVDKNRQLCHYQAEMDRILEALQSLHRSRGD